MTTNQHGRWTQTQITDLRNGLLRGESIEAIAAALDRPPGEIMAMIDRLRLSKQVFAGS